ncbi:hypothetical protein ACFYMW_37330 [Streptomyces sp. NPDC006692]|uniref:hypothetical protein n=1 Tax=unclassified Streptomyces TaxID=2593676 RepID=UPI0036CB58D6
MDPELITAWTQGYRDSERVSDEEYFLYGEDQDPTTLHPEYLPHTLKISHTPNATDVYLLNPCVLTPDGEWEAWYLAHWLPGAVRYPSFWHLMNSEYKDFHDEQ